ncbi:twin transmembrane helix small protein [Rhodobacteraceae bacterium XHP0102]|nr:twin transmembrane helix small protein [Rhodobacteraceae bacterium XHP0102]
MINDPLFIVVALACLVVVAILFLGINSFRKGTAESAKQSNKFMQARIIAQFVAVILIVLFVVLRG